MCISANRAWPPSRSAPSIKNWPCCWARYFYRALFGGMARTDLITVKRTLDYVAEVFNDRI